MFIVLLVGTASCANKVDKTQFYRLMSLKEYEGDMYVPTDFYDTITSYDMPEKLPCWVATKSKTACMVAKALYLSEMGGQRQIKKTSVSFKNSIWYVTIDDAVIVRICKTNGKIQTTDGEQRNVLVDNPKLAAEIGIAYLSDIYGEDVIKKQYPFNVIEYQNSWLVVGKLPKGSYGGTGSIVLRRRDGMVIFFTHEK